MLISSESGTGKTHFAASVIQARNPRPVLVQAFDPSDKLTSYRLRGDRVTLESWEYGQRENVWQGEKLIAVIERWHEKQGKGSAGITMKGGSKVNTDKYQKQGVVFQAYLERMKHFTDETYDNWYAYIHDSTTFCEFAVRAYLSGVMHVKDNQMIWAQATDELERFYMATFPDLDITTVVLSHASAEREKTESGIARYQVRLPGRLAKDIISSFGEVYRGYVAGGEGSLADRVYLQTEQDGVWRCSSQLGIANPFGPSPHWRTVYEAALAVRPEGEPE